MLPAALLSQPHSPLEYHTENPAREHSGRAQPFHQAGFGSLKRPPREFQGRRLMRAPGKAGFRPGSTWSHSEKRDPTAHLQRAEQHRSCPGALHVLLPPPERPFGYSEVFYGILERFGLEKTFKVHLVPHQTGLFPVSSPALDTFRDSANPRDGFYAENWKFTNRSAGLDVSTRYLPGAFRGSGGRGHTEKRRDTPQTPPFIPSGDGKSRPHRFTPGPSR